MTRAAIRGNALQDEARRGHGVAPVRTPAWAWVLCVFLAAIEPMTHLLLRHALPPGVAFSGLHIADDSGFLPALRMSSEDFFSPYVTVLHDAGPHDPRIFGAPVFWLLGTLGLPANALGMDAFLWLGLLNGAGLFCYLWAVYRFLRAVSPGRGNVAFLVFTLGGGLGGVLYLLTGVAGFHAAPWFEAFFHRYARYELIEGPFIAPWLLGQRLYYSAPLALGFAALTYWRRHRAEASFTRHLPALLLLLAATYWNARLGPLFWLAMACWWLVTEEEPVSQRARLAIFYAAPVLAAVLLVSWQMNLNPVTKAATFTLLRRSVWIGSLASAVIWQAAAAGPAIRQALAGLPLAARLLAWAAAGYLLLLAVLYAAYQTYWGNWLAGGDAAAAVMLSDWALPGALAGAFFALRAPGRSKAARAPSAVVAAGEDMREIRWVALWVLLLCAAGVSAFGQGKMLVLMPERCLVLAGVPLSLAAAYGLARLRPAPSRALFALLLVSGTASLGVGSLCFQGPVGHTPGQGPFQWLHPEMMTADEAALIDQIDTGVVLAPVTQPLYGDMIAARRPGMRTVFGQGTFAIGDRDMTELGAEVARFFEPDTPLAEREEILARYDVSYVFCPEACPVDARTVAALRHWPILEAEVSGGAVLFRVLRPVAHALDPV